MKRVLVFAAIALLTSATLADEPMRPVGPRYGQIEVDDTATPELKDLAATVRDVASRWYPILAFELPVANYRPPEKVTIVFKPGMLGVAGTGGSHIQCSASYFRKHPDDVGAIVHELVHVVQSYPKYHPVWLVEGMADYMRFYYCEPPAKRPHPDPRTSHYNDSYQTTAAFLNWARETYDRELIIKLNADCHNDRYSDDLWKKYTGKSLEDLGAEWLKSLQQDSAK